jgi:transaldolase
MQLFIDTGSVAEVEEIAAWGVLAGATTNPTLLAREQGDLDQTIARICELVDGPVSAEVMAEQPDEMVEQGHALAALDERVVVKVPFGAAGLQATHALSAEGIGVNMTLVFSPTQALLAAHAGARYVSCFMGRLDDISVDATGVLAAVVQTLRPDGGARSPLAASAQVLAASIRHPGHVVAAAKLGCDVATIPASVLRQMLGHPLTSAGIARFNEDWRSRPELADWLSELVAGPQPVAATR